MIEIKLKQWDKDWIVKKSKTITKQDGGRFLAMPTSEDNIEEKVYFICSIAMAGRGGELHNLEERDLQDITSDSGDHIARICFNRVKQSGPKSVEGDDDRRKYNKF
jgi:hypothetical protein